MLRDQTFISVKGFAKITTLSERTVWSLIQKNQLPVYRIGRRTLVRLGEGIEAIERLGRARNPIMFVGTGAYEGDSSA